MATRTSNSENHSLHMENAEMLAHHKEYMHTECTYSYVWKFKFKTLSYSKERSICLCILMFSYQFTFELMNFSIVVIFDNSLNLFMT